LCCILESIAISEVLEIQGPHRFGVARPRTCINQHFSSTLAHICRQQRNIRAYVCARASIHQRCNNTLAHNAEAAEFEILTDLLTLDPERLSNVKVGLSKARTANSGMLFELRYRELGQKIRADAATWASSFVTGNLLVSKLKRIQDDIEKLRKDPVSATLDKWAPVGASLHGFVTESKGNADFLKNQGAVITTLRAEVQKIAEDELNLLESTLEALTEEMVDPSTKTFFKDVALLGSKCKSITDAMKEALPHVLNMMPPDGFPTPAETKTVFSCYSKFAEASLKFTHEDDDAPTCPATITSNIVLLKNVVTPIAAGLVQKIIADMIGRMASAHKGLFENNAKTSLEAITHIFKDQCKLASKAEFERPCAGEAKGELLEAGLDLLELSAPMSDSLRNLRELFALPDDVSGIVTIFRSGTANPKLVSGGLSFLAMVPLLAKITDVSRNFGKFCQDWDFQSSTQSAKHKKEAIQLMQGMTRAAATEIEILTSDVGQCKRDHAKISSEVDPMESQFESVQEDPGNPLSWASKDYFQSCLRRAEDFIKHFSNKVVQTLIGVKNTGVAEVKACILATPRATTSAQALLEPTATFAAAAAAEAYEY
jgi:hypothetical protein